MIYTDREKLAIVKLSEEKDILTFDELVPVLQERPANMIYIEFDGLLYGIAGMGRIHKALHAGKNCVEISRKFTFIRPDEYMCQTNFQRYR